MVDDVDSKFFNIDISLFFVLDKFFYMWFVILFEIVNVGINWIYWKGCKGEILVVIDLIMVLF